jgi:pyruvate/2-oxoglutarate dehydrogenase complex dihydrolipoamide dehydrogenase (E3) component
MRVDRPPPVKVSLRKTGDEFDLVVIGMGSAGILAAELAAHDLGLRVAAIDRSRFGGDCLWTGCVPSKALIASARVAHTVRNAALFGVSVGEPTIELDAVWRRIAAVQAEIARTDDNPDRFRDLGVDVIEGEAVVTGPREVTVGGRVLRTRYTLVCTGSRPFIPPIDGIGDIDVLTSENLFEIERPPESLIVIGGGPMACETSQALQRLGVAVTMIARGPRPLPKDLPEHGDLLAGILRSEGVDVRLGSPAVKVRQSGEGVEVWTDAGDKVSAAGLLIAAGRVPNAHSLGLDRLGIEITGRGVTVDEHNRTVVPTIYAVGDVTGRALFTNAAAYDAVLAVRDMFLPGRGTPPGLVPWCTFTDPEVAHVGLTESQSVERHGRRKTELHRRSVAASDRARTDGVTEGEIVIVTAGGRIVGAHAICPHAGELIHELALATRARLKLSNLGELMHIYPTYSTVTGQIAGDYAIRTARKTRVLAKFGRLLG